jgi:transposase-like protein
MEVKCPNCKSKRTKRAGKYRGKYRVNQRYRCKECGRSFVERDGFEHKHYPKRTIVQALHLDVEGLTLEKIRDHLGQHFDYWPAESTILGWVKYYSKLLWRWVRRLKPRVRGRIHVDEVFVRVRGKLYPALQVVGSKTGYCHEISLERRRDVEAYERFFKRLKKQLGEQIRARFRRERRKPPKLRKLVTFVSDRLGAIRKAFNRWLHRVARLVHGVPIACKRFGLHFNNNSVERRNQEVKRRCVLTRGFKSFRSAKWFLHLQAVVTNFVRHGKQETPAHRAGVWPGLGRNRLADLIAFARAR